MSGPQPPHHLARLDDAARLAGPAIVRRRDLPKMLCTAERRSTVLRSEPEDLLATLRIHAKNGRWTSAGPHDEVTDAQAPDRPEPGGREDRGGQWLRAATHE